MRAALTVVAFLGVWAAMGGVAEACSDGGMPPGWCSDGPPERVSCDTHGDCAPGQTCSETGSCQCGTCRYGEMCMGDACRCGRQERPTPPEGCEVYLGTCGDYIVSCPPPDAGPPPPYDPCMPDSGEPAPECRSVSLPSEATDDGGCSAGGAGSASFAGWLAMLGLMRRRRDRDEAGGAR